MPFWSLILVPGKKYSQVINESFHLSMAALDLSTVPHDGKEVNFPVQLEIDSEKLILCNLSKDLHPQVQLNLNFDKGTRLNFFTTGKAAIHLTGFLNENDISDLEDFADSSDEENSEDLDSTMDSNKLTKSMPTPTKRKSLVQNDKSSASKKPKNSSSAKSDTDEDSNDESEESIDDVDIDEEEETSVDSEAGSEDDDDDNEEDDESIGDSDDDLPSKNTSVKAKQMTPNQNKKENINNKTPVSNKKTLSGDKKTPNQTPASNKKEQQKGDALSNGTTTSASAKKKKGNEQSKGEGKTASPKNTPKKQTLSGGVLVEELKEGNGPVAKPGKLVNVYYTGRLQSNNRVFDQKNQGAGFKFRLGRGEVIKGWDVALNGMKVGSKRRITIPPAMAYGNKGQPPVVPPNSTLLFDVEMRSVN